MRRWCVALLLVVFAFQPKAQTQQSIFDYDIKQWTAADGLSNNSVRAITQDQQGFLWVGTLAGLNRFDGHQFDVFNSTNTRRQLVNNIVTRLYTDKSGYIWIGTMTGLSGVNPTTLKFDRYNILGEVTAIIEISEREIWVAADNLFRVRDGQVSRVDEIKESVGQVLSANNDVWVTTSKYLYHLKIGGELEKIPLPAELAQHPIYDLAFHDNVLHLASEQGFFYLTEQGKFAPCALPSATDSSIYQLLRDSQGGDWVSTYDNLYHRHAMQTWQVVSKDSLGTTTQFADIYEDRQHNVWLASFSDGLFRASRGKINRVVGAGQRDIAVRSVAVSPDQRLFISTGQELGYLDTQQRFSAIAIQATEPLSVVQDIEFLQDKLLLATDTGPRLLHANGLLEFWLPSLKGVKTKAIKPRRAGGYWLATSQGLFSWEQGDTAQPFAFNREFESSAVTFVQELSDRLLIGTTRGAYQLKAGKLLRLGVGSNLYNAFITTMLQLSDGRLLVATIDDGLFLWHSDGRWLQYDSANGLPFEPVVSLLQPTDSTSVWASTLKGIFRFQPTQLVGGASDQHAFEEVLTPYERQLGTPPGRCCNGAGHSKVAIWQQQIWYPTLKGVVSVPLQLKAASAEKNTPVIEQVQSDSLYYIQPEQRRLVLEIDQRDLAIRYTSVEFRRPDAIEFRYRLAGFDNEWRLVGNRREAIYTNLPPGEYQFVVQSRNPNQSWEQAAEHQLELVIPRRFDETSVYRGLWLLLGLIGLAGVLWLARRNTQRREEELTRLVRQRTSELENSNLRLNEVNEELSQLTHKDALTGLRNRRFLFDQLPKDIEHYQRNRESMLAQNKCIALIHLDLDTFKQLNDKYGNNAGDAILQQLSGLLIRETRGSDYVVRYGGDEFLIVLRDVAIDLVTEFAVRLHDLITLDPIPIPDGRSVAVNCSIGFSVYPLDLLGGQLIGWEVSLRLAELALFHVKHTGRNAVATIEFDRHVDAFEFEDSEHIESQVEKLLADGAAWFSQASSQGGSGSLVE